MAVFQFTFKRYETKFLITEEQYEKLLKRLDGRMVDDYYAHSLIQNVYYDTPDFLLIRRSIEKPIYKEKLRVRAYGNTTNESKVFVEIKKKYERVVYKRRILAPLSPVNDFLSGKAPCPEDKSTLSDGTPIKGNGQIGRELTYFVSHYQGLRPAMYISYDRYSLASPTDSVLRITFDTNITWRLHELDLTKGVYGEKLDLGGMILMEIKIPDVFPLWLLQIFDDLGITRTSFSKYGTAYKTALQSGQIDPAGEAAKLLTGTSQ